MIYNEHYRLLFLLFLSLSLYANRNDTPRWNRGTARSYRTLKEVDTRGPFSIGYMWSLPGVRETLYWLVTLRETLRRLLCLLANEVGSWTTSKSAESLHPEPAPPRDPTAAPPLHMTLVGEGCLGIW